MQLIEPRESKPSVHIPCLYRTFRTWLDETNDLSRHLDHVAEDVTGLKARVRQQQSFGEIWQVGEINRGLSTTFWYKDRLPAVKIRIILQVIYAK